jgi:hypothetical protein
MSILTEAVRGFPFISPDKCGDKNSVAFVHKQIVLTERPPHVGDVSANFCR